MKKNKTSKKLNRKLKLWSMIIIIFATAFIFIYSSYAWFRATLRVEIHEFNITSAKDNDLEISLDGENWSDNVTINKKTIITDLKKIYPNHTNKWPGEGLWTVSSNGLSNIYSNYFTLYHNTKGLYHSGGVINNELTIDPIALDDTYPDDKAYYVAFDLFVRNGTPSPYGDYLYIEDTSYIESEDVLNKHNENIDSMRIGFSITPMIDRESPLNSIQNIGCNPGCSSVIYEPNSTSHVPESIHNASLHGIKLNDGQYYPTYALIRGGKDIKIWAGAQGSGKQIDATHFALQETVKDETTPITILHKGVLKMRVYVWIEAQDIDTIERINEEGSAKIAINFRKEMIK